MTITRTVPEEIAALTAERDALRDLYAGAVNHSDAAAAERDAIAEERDALKAEVEDFCRAWAMLNEPGELGRTEPTVGEAAQAFARKLSRMTAERDAAIARAEEAERVAECHKSDIWLARNSHHLNRYDGVPYINYNANFTVADIRAVLALAENAAMPSLANDLWQNDVRELRELRRIVAVIRHIVRPPPKHATVEQICRLIDTKLDALQPLRPRRGK